MHGDRQTIKSNVISTCLSDKQAKIHQLVDGLFDFVIYEDKKNA